jgi:sulfopyruvate decarboxylase beta subunit
MRYPEDKLLGILKDAGVDFTCSLPCEKIKDLLDMLRLEYGRTSLPHVPLTREEEGVGICAGISLAGKRPAIFVQSSGVGNMINALLSLTAFYKLPLAVFVSQRGIYKERIEAQFPVGRRLPGILRGAGIAYSFIRTAGEFSIVREKLGEAYRKNKIHVFLLNPAIWEGSKVKVQKSQVAIQETPHALSASSGYPCQSPPGLNPTLTRFEILKILAPHLDSKVVVCNLGFPSKELFHIRHRPSHFYMLGSMGMVTPIGLGVSLATEKDVVVIDGDGSLLMNPGTLATAACLAPKNLTIVAIDNGAYGSTGNQPTLTASCVDLEAVARGFGIRNTVKVATEGQLADVLRDPYKGLKFLHVLAVPGNEALPPISLHHLEIKRQVMEFLQEA